MTQPFQARLAVSEDGGPVENSIQKQEAISTRFERYSNLTHLLVILFLGITAVWLRWKGLSAQSFWLDEGYTLWISNLSPRDIWNVLAVDTSAPLYYVLVHYWSHYSGTSEFWLRAFSAVLATLCLPLYYFLARKILTDKAATILATAVFALSSFQIWYAKEARCYTLLVALSLASVCCLMLYLENRRPLWFSLVVALLAGSFYTHNVAFFYLPGFALLWLIYPAERKLIGRIGDGLLAYLAVLLLYVPWLPILHAQLERQRIHGNFWLAVPRVRDLLESVSILAGFDPTTLQTVFRGFFHSSRLFGFWTWVPLILLVVLICVFGGLYTTSRADTRKTAALAAYSLSPLLLAFSYSRISGPIYTTRLFLGSCALLPIVLATPVAFQFGRRRRAFELLGCVMLLGVVASTFGYLRRERKEDWRGVAQYLASLPERPRLLVVVPDIGQPLMSYYVSQLPKTGPAMAVTGLLTTYNAPDKDFERRTLELSDDPHTDVLALLSHRMASETYGEIEVVLQPAAPATLVQPMVAYLDAQCSSVEVLQFHWLEVRRCSVRSLR